MRSQEYSRIFVSNQCSKISATTVLSKDMFLRLIRLNREVGNKKNYMWKAFDFFSLLIYYAFYAIYLY